jgi:hypothetical protein
MQRCGLKKLVKMDKSSFELDSMKMLKKKLQSFATIEVFIKRILVLKVFFKLQG